MASLIVASGGPSGEGKTAVSKAVAQALEIPHSDTGAMYRAIALKAVRNGVAEDDEKALAQLAVGCTHRSRGNAVGAKRLLLRAAAGLVPYLSAPPHDLNLAQLIDWAEQPVGCPMPRLRDADPPGGRRETEDRHR